MKNNRINYGSPQRTMDEKERSEKTLLKKVLNCIYAVITVLFMALLVFSLLIFC